MAIETEIGNMMALQCRNCSEIFFIPSRRGRPPVLCDKCGGTNGSDEATRQRLIAAAKIRVDNLEMMLRSRGNHISQHRHEWE